MDGSGLRNIWPAGRCCCYTHVCVCGTEKVKQQEEEGRGNLNYLRDSSAYALLLGGGEWNVRVFCGNNFLLVDVYTRFRHHANANNASYRTLRYLSLPFVPQRSGICIYFPDPRPLLISPLSLSLSAFVRNFRLIKAFWERGRGR